MAGTDRVASQIWRGVELSQGWVGSGGSRFQRVGGAVVAEGARRRKALIDVQVDPSPYLPSSSGPGVHSPSLASGHNDLGQNPGKGVPSPVAARPCRSLPAYFVNSSLVCIVTIDRDPN